METSREKLESGTPEPKVTRQKPYRGNNQRSIQIAKDACGACGACVAVCRPQAMVLHNNFLEHIAQKCTLCLLCVGECPTRALRLTQAYNPTMAIEGDTERQASQGLFTRQLTETPNPLQVIRDRNLTLPGSLLLIADGNGRWAKQHNLPVIEGHRKGAEAIREMLKNIRELPQINTAIIWTMSPDNIANRTPEEIAGINSVICDNAASIINEVEENNGRFMLLGNTGSLTADFRKFLNGAEKRTRNNTGQTIVLANNYSGGQEIVNRSLHLAIEVVKNKTFNFISFGRVQLLESDLSNMGRLIDPRGIGEIDLAIRTGGELRTSGFGWRTDKAELYFTKTLLPDFSRLDLALALTDYAFRDRQNGGRPK